MVYYGVYGTYNLYFIYIGGVNNYKRFITMIHIKEILVHKLMQCCFKGDQHIWYFNISEAKYKSL